MSKITENEFNRIFLKNFFKEVLQEKGNYPVDKLDEMTGILADLFMKEFGSGNTPDQLIKNHKNIQEWLKVKIENFQT